MITWFAGACALITPLDGVKPVEEIPFTTSQAEEIVPSATALADQTETAVVAAAWSFETGTRSGDSSDPSVVVNIHYPILSGASEADNQAFNNAVQTVEDEVVADFLAGLAENNIEAAPNTAEQISSCLGGYTILHASTRIVSLTLDFSNYVSGAAHPISFQHTLNYDFDTHKVLSLADLFIPDSDYLNRIAGYAQQDLTAREMLFYPEGAAAEAQNYQSWVLSNEGLTVLFDVYQVAPYAAGPQQVTIPFEALADMLQPTALEQIHASVVYLKVNSAPVEYPEATP